MGISPNMLPADTLPKRSGKKCVRSEFSTCEWNRSVLQNCPNWTVHSAEIRKSFTSRSIRLSTVFENYSISLRSSPIQSHIMFTNCSSYRIAFPNNKCMPSFNLSAVIVLIFHRSNVVEISVGTVTLSVLVLMGQASRALQPGKPFIFLVLHSTQLPSFVSIRATYTFDNIWRVYDDIWLLLR